MQLWWRLRGWVRLRLTSADCAGRLRAISREIRLEQIVFVDELVVEFDVSRGDMERITVRDGERLELLREGGLPAGLARVRRWRILVSAAVLFGILTVVLPTRILFVRVEGSGEIPERLILERAEECGVYFGASRRALRSEQVKNHLLWAIPELRWAGVNTEGCTATITVAVRDGGEEPEDGRTGDIVAASDAVVTELYPRTGTAQASPGQAVRAGQILISGATDLGLSTRVDRAEGEVYGLTRRTVEAALPENTRVRRENGRVVRKYSLRIGKKYVNFSNDSGILYGTCVKMRTVKDLTLPGGFKLPVALVTETYYLCETEEVPRENGGELLLEAARGYARERMTAGIILEEETAFAGGALTAVFECREMIGVFRPGVYMERDTNDRENGERGAG